MDDLRRLCDRVLRRLEVGVNSLDMKSWRRGNQKSQEDLQKVGDS